MSFISAMAKLNFQKPLLTVHSRNISYCYQCWKLLCRSIIFSIFIYCYSLLINLMHSWIKL